MLSINRLQVSSHHPLHNPRVYIRTQKNDQVLHVKDPVVHVSVRWNLNLVFETPDRNGQWYKHRLTLWAIFLQEQYQTGLTFGY